MATNEGMFSEKALVSICKLGGSEVAFHSLVDSISIDQGDKDIEGVPVVGGGRLTKKKPQGDITISFDGYPTTVLGSDSKGIAQLFQDGSTIDGASVYSTTKRQLWRVTILMTNDPTATVASSATAASTDSMRYCLVHCYCISANADFSDGYKWSFKFKGTPFNKFGSANVQEASVEASAITALSTYNTTNFAVDDSNGYTWA